MSVISVSMMAAVGLTVAAVEVPYERSEWTGSRPGERERAVKKTLIYAERQPYGPYSNYLHWFDDRPLYMDVSLRDRNDIGANYAGFFHDVDIAKQYGINGFAAISNFSTHLRQLDLLSRQPEIPWYSHMIVLVCGWGENMYPTVKDMIVRAAKSPYTARHDGKLLLWVYGGGTGLPWMKKWSKKLREDKDIPPFMLIGEAPYVEMYSALGSHPDGNVPAETVEAYRQKVAEAVSVLDGVQMWTVGHKCDHLGEYGWWFHATDVYRKYQLPIVKEVLSRPENRGKLVGDYIQTQYVNPDSGAVDSARGTEALRLHLDELAAINPDILTLFEWNEEYENTHLQPTVAHGRAFERIINYYRSLYDRTPLVPRPGDDVSVPNLIVSARRAIQLGESWHCELLYVPDGSAAKEVKATVKLVDNRGREMRLFPTETFATDRIRAIDYRVSSTNLADCGSVMPIVETEMDGVKRTWTGLASTRIRATTTTGRDFLYLNCPLREVLQPVERTFTVKPTGEDGVYEVEGSFTAGEKLASLEIIDDVEEIAAADSENRFDRAKCDLFRGVFTTSTPWKLGRDKRGNTHQGTIEVAGSKAAKLESGCQPWEVFHVLGRTNGAWRVSNNFAERAWGTFLLAVPKSDAAKARFVLDFPGFGHFEKNLAEVLKLGKFALEFTPEARIELERLDDLGDLPRHLGVDSAKVCSRLKSPNRFPSFQLRAISESGRIWRSPVRFPKAPGEARRTLEVISTMNRKIVPVEVAADLIPDIRYRFTPEHGAWLMSDGDRRFDISLGGAGRDGGSMISYRAKKDRFAEDYSHGDPLWERLPEGGWALRFSKSAYLNLFPETVPHSSEFTIAFSIKPGTAADQTLFRTMRVTHEECGLQAVIAGGKLKVIYIGENSGPLQFATGLEVKAGEWNDISISRNFHRFTVRVNGATKSAAYDRRSSYLQSVNFGGNVAPGTGIPEGIRPFEGLLRSFRVSHRYEGE